MPGFDSTLFVDLNDSLSNHLKCGICADIFSNPVETKCKHTFCEDCIKPWLTSHTECPFCRHELNICDISINRLIKEIINDLKVKCESNHCQTVVPFGSLAAHLNECPFRICAECGLFRGDMTEHNCLQLVKLDLVKKREEIVKLEGENNKLKIQNELTIKVKTAEIETLQKTINNLEHELIQLRGSLGQILDRKSCYVDHWIHPKKSNCFEIINVDIDHHKLIKIDRSFIKVQLNKMISSKSASYDHNYSINYCMKKGINFLSLRNALMNSDRERPQLMTETGRLIADFDTPLSLDMSDDCLTYRIRYYYHGEQHHFKDNKRHRH